MNRWLLALALVVLPAASFAADAGQEPPDAGSADASVAPGDAARKPRPQTRKLAVKARAVAPDASLELTAEQRVEDVRPDVHFELVMPRLADVRVRLLDEADKAVPSTDKLDHAGAETTYVLTPAEPLVTGSRYVLLVDGLQADFATDAQGQAYDDVRFELRTAGEKPPPPAKAAKNAKKSKRRK